MDRSFDEKGCHFLEDGCQCQDPRLPEKMYCFWHEPSEDKSGDGVRERLEIRARTDRPMDGFKLVGANLENINLVHSSGEPYHLINSDLRRANLKRAHLYQVDMSGCQLLKANLAQANLHFVNLSGCDLLGVNFNNAHLEHVHWGDVLYQEQKAKSVPDEAARYYEEAEEVARNIRRHCEQQGMHQVAGYFFYREMVCRRLQMPALSLKRLISYFIDLVSGYGESPRRVVQFSGLLVIFCSLIYFQTGIQDGGLTVQYQPTADWLTNLKSWLDCLYFSIVTFTTLGYGDLIPLGWSRMVAAFEAFIGSFSLALFVVLFVKKMTR